MQLSKLISLRDGQRRLISRQLVKFEEELSLSEHKKLLEILTEKAETVKTLNEKIINHADITDLETELVESEEYSIDLEMKLQNRYTLTGQDSAPPTEQVSLDSNKPYNSSTSYHKLPKLTLPNFDGEITEWQTFWGCFESSVHSNHTLSDVQKFSYLRSLLHGVAASCIVGFPLTHANYAKAVDLLKERFGQPHKIISKYMQSFLELPRPENVPHSLQNFHDKLETYIRGLESLGQYEDSYGDLLVPIIRDKLPSEIRRSMARDHGNRQWKLADLREALEKEINILQEGETTEFPDAHIPTASFFTGNKGPSRKQTSKRKHTKPFIHTRTKCPFCEEEHIPSACKNVPTVEARTECVKRKRLCFNCLAESHQVTSCRSQYRCRHCHRKHHTAICEQQKKSTTLNAEATTFQPNQGKQSDTAILYSTTQHRPNVLLKTAIAKVCSTHYTVDANILFDEGAQRSFITKKLAEKLAIQRTGTDTIHLASFGDATQNVRHMATATVFLITDKGKKIPVQRPTGGDVIEVPTRPEVSASSDRGRQV